jgi:histidine ammonia-lyase
VTVSIGGRGDLTLETFRRVAWVGESVTIASEARQRMDQAHHDFLALVESLKRRDPKALIYGVTTGPGDSGSRVLSEEAQRQRPTRIWTAASFGDPLPVRVVRGIILARLANFIDGNAGARSEVACEVAAMLDREPLPQVPAEGNGGSGEILALGHLFYGLSERMVLEPKERMALINGSPCAAAMLADACLAGRGRLELAEKVFALSLEAIGAPLEAYSQDLEGLWNDGEETRALHRIRTMVASSPRPRLSSQAPVSHRILPRVLGQVQRAQAQAEAAADIALQSVTDNPVFIPPNARHPEGAILSNGGFHNARATAALDALTFAWADLCQLAQRHLDKLFQHSATAGRLDDEWGLKPVHMVQTGWAEQARALAQPSLLSLGSFGQNDVPAMSFFAWGKATGVGHCLDASLAVLAAVALQAIDSSGGQLAPALEEFAEDVRSIFPPVAGVRRTGADFERLAKHFTAQSLTRA